LSLANCQLRTRRQPVACICVICQELDQLSPHLYLHRMLLTCKVTVDCSLYQTRASRTVDLRVRFSRGDLRLREEARRATAAGTCLALRHAILRISVARRLPRSEIHRTRPPTFTVTQTLPAKKTQPGCPKFMLAREKKFSARSDVSCRGLLRTEALRVGHQYICNSAVTELRHAATCAYSVHAMACRSS